MYINIICKQASFSAFTKKVIKYRVCTNQDQCFKVSVYTVDGFIKHHTAWLLGEIYINLLFGEIQLDVFFVEHVVTIKW